MPEIVLVLLLYEPPLNITPPIVPPWLTAFRAELLLIVVVPCIVPELYAPEPEKVAEPVMMPPVEEIATEEG